MVTNHLQNWKWRWIKLHCVPTFLGEKSVFTHSSWGNVTYLEIDLLFIRRFHCVQSDPQGYKKQWSSFLYSEPTRFARMKPSPEQGPHRLASHLSAKGEPRHIMTLPSPLGGPGSRRLPLVLALQAHPTHKKQSWDSCGSKANLKCDSKPFALYTMPQAANL